MMLLRAARIVGSAALSLQLIGTPISSGSDSAGIAPVDPLSNFRLRIEPVAGQPAQKSLIFGPRSIDRAHTVTFRNSLTGGALQPLSLTAQTDSGLERAGTDLSALDPARFYRVEIKQLSQPGGIADPAQLPIAARQVPAFQSYAGRTLRAGQSYIDPATGARVTKLTDALIPVGNTNGLHHYASGPVQISRDWGDGSHTINVTAAGGDYLVDYRRGGTLSNWRAASFTGPDLSFGFSLNPATPRIAFAVRDMVLQRYDTEPMALANTGHFPKDFSAQGNDYLVWLQNDKNDEWFVMMMQNGGKVIAWNSQTDQTLTLSVSGLDEPHLDRDGRYVFIAREADWLIWDLQTNTTRAPLATPFRGHPGAFRSLFAASDGNTNPATLWRHDPVAQQSTTLYVGEQIGNGGQHRGDQWIMTDAQLGGDLTKQWMLQTVHDEGVANAGMWTLESGEIYSAPVSNWGSAYGKPAIGIRAVRQYVAGDNTRFSASLNEVAMRNAMVEGAFYYDAANTRVFAWLVGGGSPANRVEIKAPAEVHDAIALLRLDGSEARLAAHHYSLNCEPQYDAMPKATISPDGKLIVFNSNMNDSDGRVDVFAVEVPVR